MWVEKYAPSSLRQLVGNREAVEGFLHWLKNWKKGRAALLYGSPGVGKTTLVHLAGKMMGWDIVEMNASDLRNREGIVSTLGSASRQASLFGRGKIILADEVDGVAGRKDRGGISEIVSTIRESSFPVVLTANKVKVSESSVELGRHIESYMARKKSPNKFALFQFLKKAAAEEGKNPNEKWIWRIVFTHFAEIEKNEREGIKKCLQDLLGGGDEWWSWESKLAPLRPVCDLFRFEKPSVGEISSHLERVCGGEKVECCPNAIGMIASKSGGDVRAAVNTLQGVALGKGKVDSFLEIDERDGIRGVAEALRVVYKTGEFGVARSALDNLGIEPNHVSEWLSYNLPSEYCGKDLAKGLDMLSKADVFSGRIFRRQHWKLMKYQLELMAGVALAKGKRSSFAGAYSSPLEKFSGSGRKAKRLRAQIAGKLSPVLHVSRRTAKKEYIWFLPVLLERDKSLGDSLRLDDEELEFLGVKAEKRSAKGRAKSSPKAAKKRGRGKAA